MRKKNSKQSNRIPSERKKNKRPLRESPEADFMETESGTHGGGKERGVGDGAGGEGGGGGEEEVEEERGRDKGG